MTDSNPQDGQVAEQTTMAQEMKKAFLEAEQKETEDESDQSESTSEDDTSEEDGATTPETERDDTDEGEDGSVEEPEEAAEKEFPLIPNNWSDDEKKAFQDLLDSDEEGTRVGAEIMLERYNSFKKTFFEKTEQYAKDTKELKPIVELFQPFESTMTANGVDKSTYIKNMITWEMSLQKDPVNTVKSIMQKFGIRPEQISPKRDEYEFDDDLTTEEPDAKMSSRLDKIESENNTLRTQLANQPVLAQLRQFEEATDAKGKVLHPHFAEVRPIMGQLIQQGKVTTLQEAYTKAIKVLDLDVEVKSDDTDNAVDLDKIRQKVKKAKKASKGVTTKGGKADLTSMSLKDELRAHFKS